MHVHATDLASSLSPANQPITNAAAINARPQAATTPSTTTPPSSTNGGLTGTTTGTTFLNLLVKELQNQDPTAPMDSTQMVGQMISLNQLDQLISINQTLSTATASRTATSGSSSSGSGSGKGATPGISPSSPTGGSETLTSAEQIAQRTALLSGNQNGNAVQAATQAADPTSILDLSNLNMPNGGK